MARIGVFDSGVGGLSVLREIIEMLPNEQYVYYGDNANCPYGPKGESFIRQRADEITQLLLKHGCQAIVVACNTATSYSIEYLRDHYTIPFIGMVPAVKPAAKITHTGVVGVLATAGTLNAPLYNRIKETYGKDVKIVEHVGQGFVELVEALDIDSPHAEAIVEASVQPIMSKGADTLVLGCSHYPFLLKVIKRVANRLKRADVNDVDVIDPAPAIAKNLVNVLSGKNISVNDGTFQIKLISSGDDNVIYRLCKTFITKHKKGISGKAAYK